MSYLAGVLGRMVGLVAAAPLGAAVLGAGVLAAAGAPDGSGSSGGPWGPAAGAPGDPPPGAGSRAAVGSVAALAVRGIPPAMLALYRAAPAAECPGLSWTVLAAIGKVETDHGRGSERSPAGAEGPMQFMPGTWAVYGTDGDGDGRADVWDPADAVWSAARMLCADGAGSAGGVAGAVYDYNHSWAYVSAVAFWADAYGSAPAG